MELENRPAMAADARHAIINVRRYCRWLDSARRRCLADGRKASRVARKLRVRGSPFDRARIEMFEASAEESRNAVRGLNSILMDCGRWLLEFAPYLDAALTLEERLDLLGVNAADRARLAEADETGIVAIVAVYGLEDSATYRGSEFKDGPMAAAINKVLVDFMCNHEQGQQVAHSLFEAGGLFDGVPRYAVGQDGALKRMPPRLCLVTGKS